jgi:phosphatidylserine/phosphatidylglycerophosphate/cardiolipin synthase-like enzyme
LFVNYRRVLLLTEVGKDAAEEAATIRRVAPQCERLVIVARMPVARFAWLSGQAPADLNDAATASVERLRRTFADLAPAIDVTLAPDAESEQLIRIAEDAEIDLVVTGERSFADSAAMAELRRRQRIALLWTAPGERPLEEILCVAFGRRARAAIASFLRDHGSPSLRVTILMGDAPEGGGLDAALDIAGIEAKVKVMEAGVTSLRAIGSAEQPIGLLVLARFPAPLLIGARPPFAVLVLPPVATPSAGLVRAIDVPDLVDQSGTIRFRVDYATGAGRNAPIPDQDIAFVSRGRIVATVRTENGHAELPPGLEDVDSFGIFRIRERNVTEPLAAIELSVNLVRPGSRPLVLFDADLDMEIDKESRGATAASAVDGAAAAPQWIAVRMRPMKSCRSLRSRLRASGIAVPVIDASVVLDEGEAFDVPEEVDPVRLARVGARMRADGFPVVAIVHHGPHAPLTIGFAALTADRLEEASWSVPHPLPLPASLDRRLESTTGARLIEGNHVEVELDNAMARRWLLEAIAKSRERVHLQAYMFADDDVGRQIEGALADAAARGVAVRLLVDSLHALHGSFGATNPLLERLGTQRGIDLRLSRPITGVPSLQDLKQRDHKKIVVVDGELALAGGRNISHEYYTGFEEEPLTERSLWRDVPWLDAGARIEGPAVSAIEEAFLEAWLDAGGSPFDVAAGTPKGTTAARVVVHRGLRDARTLEAYLALIDTAASHVYAVNGFPLILEIQHALLRALARGVRVRTLVGHLTPTHGGQPFGGPWSSARTAATELVHSRIDALIAAGGEAYQFAVRQQPRWAPSLGTVSPHVHAKVMSADGRVCAVGSANLDITAGYWESELLLLIEDECTARKLEARLDELIAASDRVDRDDPEWQEVARRRQWMRHWPGVLSV